MRFTRSIYIVLLITTIAQAQQLPMGEFHPNRERTYDITHYKANLQVDWNNKKISGEATVTFHPLTDASSFSLDAYWLRVVSVQEYPSRSNLKFTSTDSTLVFSFNRTIRTTDTVSVVIQYSATPTAGLYFVDSPEGSTMLPSIYTYGEGGLHANWLPIYNDTNDKFPTEMTVTVAKPYEAISNGTLVEKKENSDGTRTFHWLQKLPHSNYLIALFVGDYESVKLRPAFGTIPLTAWVPRGQTKEGAYVFQRTSDMVEFFSNRFNYRYPWDKYDQVAAYDYAIGAMENTSVTGHIDRVLRTEGAQDLFNPDFSNYTSNWTAEATISHELAHHWFGDNTTCRSLGSIWLNESFASYCMMLWDEKRVGEEYLQFETWLALQAYLKFVAADHMIRPMEYRRFDTREEIYNEQTTYLKGGVVLNMLRWIMGDEDFFKGMSYYLHKHNFSNVESTDLKIALEEATGKNLDWFFQQWVYSGGNPRFEVSYNYVSSKKKLELTVRQTQPLVKGQMIFKLPVEIRIDTKSKKLVDTVWVENQVEHFLFDVSEKPAMVSFDGRGVLVCDLIFDKSQEELIYQLENDALPGKLWALHQLVKKFSSNPKTLTAMKSVLSGNGAWWLKSETALQLQYMHIDGAEELLIQQLKAKDYHIRTAAALALGSHFTKSSANALRNAVQSDASTTVAGMAAVSLAKIDPSLSVEFFKNLLSRSSWYDELRYAALIAMGQMENEKFVPLIKGYVSSKYNMAMRQQALESWAACAPNDPALTDALLAAARKEISRVRASAMGLLGKLKVERALPVLQEISRKDGDSDIRKQAKDVMEEIQRAGDK